MNEHRLYIVLGCLLLVMGALGVRRRDPIGAMAFLIAGAGVIANGFHALRKRIIPYGSRRTQYLRLVVLLFSIGAAMVIIVLEE